jgi:hypothetical protein
MSDIFDHELDAWESYDRVYDDREYSGLAYNPDYYHSWIRVHEILSDTATGLSVSVVPGFQVFIPNKLIRGKRKVTRGWEIFVHPGTLFKILKRERASLVCELPVYED